jgi:hypothetical protein
MRKNVYIIFGGLILVLSSFYIGRRYHFMFDSTCGTGIDGLKYAGIAVLLILTVFVLFELGRNNRKKAYCTNCSAKMQDEWGICPYCGKERTGGR